MGCIAVCLSGRIALPLNHPLRPFCLFGVKSPTTLKDTLTDGKGRACEDKRIRSTMSPEIPTGEVVKSNDRNENGNEGGAHRFSIGTIRPNQTKSDQIKPKKAKKDELEGPAAEPQSKKREEWQRNDQLPARNFHSTSREPSPARQTAARCPQGVARSHPGTPTPARP